MDNKTRRELLQRHKGSNFPGSIIDVFKAYEQGVDLIGQYQQQMQVANTPQQQQQGLRPQHQAGNTNASMAFPNTPPNASFNTVGMKAPINMKQYDDFGNLVKSYDRVPPGVTDLKMSSQGGTVIETPAQMQSGGVKKYQNGTPVGYLLNTLESQDPYAAAAQNAQNAQNSLSNEQQRVLNVRNNVIPTAQRLYQRQQNILNEITPEHKRANEYYNEMQNLSDKEFWNTPRSWFGGEEIDAQQKLREMQRSPEFPQVLRDVLPNNGMYNVSQVDSGYDTDRQVYCTPYGCLPYQQAGATDLPTVLSNPKFQAGVREGSLPFEKINSTERQPGDISLIVGSAPVEYSNPLGPRTVRAHHTTIYAGDNNPGSANPQSINAYSAHHGAAMDFKMAEHDAKDRPFEFYRYIGQTPRMQKNVGYANDVAQAIGTKPEESLRPSMSAPELLASLPPQQFLNSYSRNSNLSLPELDYENVFTNSTNKTKKFNGSKFGTNKDIVMNKFGGVRKYQYAGAVNLPPAEVIGYSNVNVANPNYFNQGAINEYRPGRWESFKDAMHEHNSKDDSTFENFVEFFDPTGVSSWDDAYRAYNSMKSKDASSPNFDEGLDMFGALPLVGKFRRSINLGKGAAKHFGDIKNLGASAYNALTKGADVINRVDAIEDETGFLDNKKNGGVRKKSIKTVDRRSKIKRK